MKITPAMIKVGRNALVGFNPDFESHEDAAERIFLAMLDAAADEEEAHSSLSGSPCLRANRGLV